jgi:integrase
LKRRDFTFGEINYVGVLSSNIKNKKPDECPFSQQLAKDLEQYFNSSPAMPQTKAFSGMWKDSGAKMLLPDLQLAKIEAVNDEGKIDFHSLRHTFGIMAALAGVGVEKLQKLMRHSDINLTMSIYTHTPKGQAQKAIESLPDSSLPSSQAQKATGTDDKLAEGSYKKI